MLVDSDVLLDEDEVDGAKVGIEIRVTAPSKSAFSPVIGNTVRDSLAEGLLISGPFAPRMSHNIFQRNKGGVRFRDGAQPVLVGNVFEKSALELLPGSDLKAVREHNFFIEERRAGR